MQNKYIRAVLDNHNVFGIQQNIDAAIINNNFNNQ